MAEKFTSPRKRPPPVDRDISSIDSPEQSANVHGVITSLSLRRNLKPGVTLMAILAMALAKYGSLDGALAKKK